MNFHLTSTSLEHIKLKKDLLHQSTGAFICFEGRVRNHNMGRAVIGLEYEAYPDLCEAEMENIFNEVRDKFSVYDAVCHHRVGALGIGDVSVWIGVSAAHRDDAFKACRYLIDQLKFRLPIWKKELYVEGDSGWINCQDEPLPPVDRNKYYSRQKILKDIGTEGQQKLEKSKVLVVGAGGLGCAALFGLAGSGIGTLGICEFDLLDESNLHRQFIYSHEDLGKPKIDLAAARIQSLNPSITIIRHGQRLDVDNVADIIKPYELIVDCTDNYKTKFLLNDACVLYEKILIQASIYQSDGQVHTYIPHQGSCLRCIWPETIQPGCVANCAEAGVFGDVAAIIGHVQSLQTVKTILGINRHQNDTLIYDLQTHIAERIRRPANPDCPVCGEHPTITSLDTTQYQRATELSIDINQLSDEEILSSTFVDVREAYERVLCPLKQINSLHCPSSEFSIDHAEFDSTARHLVFCAKGIRSLAIVEQLHQCGRNNFISIDNDIHAINSRVLQIKDTSFLNK